MPSSPEFLDRLRSLCLALPEAREVEAWGAPTFRVKTMFATYSAPDGYGAEGRPSAWVRAEPVNQDLLMGSDPDRFFVPPYVGGKGWIGVYLDDATDWDQLARLLRDGWRMSVPKKLLEQEDEGG